MFQSRYRASNHHASPIDTTTISHNKSRVVNRNIRPLPSPSPQSNTPPPSTTSTSAPAPPASQTPPPSSASPRLLHQPSAASPPSAALHTGSAPSVHHNRPHTSPKRKRGKST